MKTVTMDCPKCGRSLEFPNNQRQTKCLYCGSTVYWDDEAKHTVLDNAEQVGYEFEKGRIKAQQEISYSKYHAPSNYNPMQTNDNGSGNGARNIIVVLIIAVSLLAVFVVINNMSGFSSSGNKSANLTNKEAINSYEYETSNSEPVKNTEKNDLENSGTSNAIQPTADNTQIVSHKNDLSFKGTAVSDQKATITFKALTSGKHWITLVDVYAQEDFEINIYDSYNKKVRYANFPNYMNGADVELTKDTEYTIVINDEYGNNKVGSFTLIIKNPDDIISIDSSKDFVQTEIRYTNQHLEFEFIPQEDGDYCITFVKCAEQVRIKEFGFIDIPYGQKIGIHGYTEASTSEGKDLKKGQKYKIIIINGGDDTNVGTVVFKVERVSKHSTNT